MNGLRAIGIGVSTRQGGNAIIMGEMVQEKLNQLKNQLPVGIEIQGIYFADQVAIAANNEFIKNLIISVSIVVIVILFAMGVRAGMLIGSSLIFSILGTLFFMYFFEIELHRTSLAAIIVAMGMLVDNAIVVTDNAQVAMKRGTNKIKALIDGASIPQWALLGATIIAILSFLPLYQAPSNTAEIIKPLFIVMNPGIGQPGCGHGNINHLGLSTIKFDLRHLFNSYQLSFQKVGVVLQFVIIKTFIGS